MQFTRLRKGSHVIFPLAAEKAFNESQHPFTIGWKVATLIKAI